LNLQLIKTRGSTFYTVIRSEKYIKTREIIYALMKTVCSNTINFLRLKTHSKYVLYAQVFKTRGNTIHTLMRTEKYINIRAK
jgi:hypothetical protein